MEEKQLEDFLPDKNTSYIKTFNNSIITNKINEEQIIECIRTVVDPEIPVNLYDLGLISVSYTHLTLPTKRIV